MTMIEILERDVKHYSFGKNFTGKVIREDEVRLIPTPNVDMELKVLECNSTWIRLSDEGPEIHFQLMDSNGKVDEYRIDLDHVFETLRAETSTEFIALLSKYGEEV